MLKGKRGHTNFDAIDRILIAGSLVGAVVLSYLLINDQWITRRFITRLDSGKAIGEVLVVKNDVRRRMSQSLTWYDARENETLFERDTVFTGSDSELQFKIGQDNEVTLQSDSMVVLQTQNDELIFDLRLGTLSANPTTKKTIKIIHEGQLAEVRADSAAAPLIISKNQKGSLSISSQTGDVDISIGHSKTRIKKNEQLQIDKDQKTKKHDYFAKFVSHQPRDSHWINPSDAVTRQVQLGWENQKPETQLKLQVATSPQFSIRSLALDKNVIGSNESWQIDKERTYYYRLVDVTSGEVASATQQLDVYELRPIALKSPLQDEKFFADTVLSQNQSKPFRFQWIKKSGVTEYRIDVAKDEKLTEIVHSKTEKGNNIILSLSGGSYYWQVRPLKPQKDELVSEVRRFTVGQEAALAPKASELAKITPPEPEIPPRMHGPERPPARSLSNTPPKIVKPADKVTLKYSDRVDVRSPASIENALQNPPELTWAQHEGASSFKVEIDSNKNFESPQVIDDVTENSFLWKSAKPGTYYWRVRAKDTLNNETKPSAYAKLDILLSKPKLKYETLESDEIEDPALADKPKTTILRWSRLPHAEAYHVVVDDQLRTVSSEEVSIDVLPNKKTLVKVAAVSKTGQPLSAFSEHAYMFERKVKSELPELLLPADSTTIVAFDSKENEPIVFFWKGVKGAKKYEVQFASDKDFSKEIALKEANSNKLILKEKFANGKIYWRVRAVFGSVGSDWSPVRSYEMQKVFSD